MATSQLAPGFLNVLCVYAPKAINNYSHEMNLEELVKKVMLLSMYITYC